jgi:3-methyladenine DNA glycosylase AlkD
MVKKPDLNEVIKILENLAIPNNIEGMARYGIKTDQALGIPIPSLRKLAKEIGQNHQLALLLWNKGFHEARILATMIDDPKFVTEKQLDQWVKDFNSWDLCDQCCNNLLGRTKWSYQKALEWSSDNRLFVKRAGFVLIAVLAVHDKKADDREFLYFLNRIKQESMDERNFVKKAVNWALRQIGKRNRKLNKLAIETSKEIQKNESKTARWIAKDALRELRDEKIQKRLKG